MCRGAYVLLPDFNLTDAEWNGLMVPINMAFFFKSSLEDRVVALYPSPAGATESLLALESWNDIVERNPVLNEMESDVEGSAGQPRWAMPADIPRPSTTCFPSTNATSWWA